EEEELLAACLGEGRDCPLHRLVVLGGGVNDEVGDVLAEPGVVVGEVGLGILLGPVAEGEVGERGVLWRLTAARVRPRLLEALAPLGELLRWRTGGDPAVA